MLPNFLTRPGLMLRLLLELQQEQANGAPCECLFVNTFILSDRNLVLEITEAMIDTIVQNFNTLGESGRIPISVNHNTGGDTLETARAVGWIVKLFKQTSDEGRISLMMEPKWLDDARTAIEQEHFRFLSVGMMLHDKHPVSGEEIGPHVLEVSLTNVPALSGLEPITLTALNAPTKVALSTQSVLALYPGNSLELAMEGGLPGSLMERVECVISCFYKLYPDTNETMWFVRDVSTDQCIVSRRSRQDAEQTWQVGYQMAVDGTCTFQPMPQWIEVQQVYVPVTAAQLEPDLALGAMKPTPNCPMAPEGAVWDSGAAMGRVKSWATKADDTVDIAKYRQAFAWNDGSENLTGNKLPHHDVIGGQLKVVRTGVVAAGNAVQGSRGGVGIPDTDMSGVKRHLAAHYQQFDLQPPWESQQNATHQPDSANLLHKQQTQAAGTEPAASNYKEQKKMDEIQIRSLLGLAADVDLAMALPALAAKPGEVDALKAKIAELEQVKATADAATAKLTTQEGQILTLTQQKTAFEQETTTLATRLQALEAERNERDAKDRIDLALKNRKVKPAELEAEGGFLRTLAKEQPGTFDKIMSARPAYTVDLTIEVGSDAEGTLDEQPADKLFRLTDEALDKDANLRPQEARALVLSRNPELKTAIPTTKTGTR